VTSAGETSAAATSAGAGISAAATSEGRLTRLAVGYTLFGALAVGALATFAPRTFYEDFPFFASWVDNLPPYNRHLVTDTGGLYLGFALLLGWSLRRPALVVPVCTAFVLTQVLHTAFHFAHLDGFTVADGVTQMAALLGLVAAPLVAILSSPARPGGSGSR
jgi:hypothetical protein